VIAFLSIERHVLVAETLEALERKPVVGTLGFLQTKHVGANRLHGTSRRCRCATAPNLMFQVVIVSRIRRIERSVVSAQ